MNGDSLWLGNLHLETVIANRMIRFTVIHPANVSSPSEAIYRMVEVQGPVFELL